MTGLGVGLGVASLPLTFAQAPMGESINVTMKDLTPQFGSLDELSDRQVARLLDLLWRLVRVFG